ncbi:hypothetical protein [Spartinivicinus marinus]|uniref:hypothetical protein n=1 Tax=Spartinivicinus marinus TaxID=2994442 RepID=UPI0022566B75|nr:hypothetical protein [Spartinivicinus marinus]MCX4024735.1 hypothetical protein [Spartinivicinus marinus]
MTDKDVNVLLAQLHKELAEHLLEKLRNGEMKAAELNVARQMLKDNHINEFPSPTSPLAELENKLNEVDPFDPDDVRYTH